MKTKFKKQTLITTLALACVCSFSGGMMLAASAESDSSVQTLSGFECKGASVNATQMGMRFEFNLSGEAVNKASATAGVVYMPYDLYSGDTADFVKGYAKAATATFNWQDNAATEDATDKVGYTYLSADKIPSDQYNRVLLVRGYIEDGENVYYTAPVKTSMAYSAWKGSASLSEYAEQLKAYMGPYTLTYGEGDAEKLTGLYYGDTLELPDSIGGNTVDQWYWDEGKTVEIKTSDYATGTMQIYYELHKVEYTGTITAPEGVNVADTTLKVDGETKTITVSGSKYTANLPEGEHTVEFINGDYSYAETFTVSESASKDIELFYHDSMFNAIGNYSAPYKGTGGVSTVYGAKFASFAKANATGRYTVTPNSDHYLSALFTESASKEGFTYTAVLKTAHAQGEQFGISLVNGWLLLGINFSYGNDKQSIITCNCLNDGTGAGTYISYNDTEWLKTIGKDYSGEIKVSVEVNPGQSIKCYVFDTLRFTITANENKCIDATGGTSTRYDGTVASNGTKFDWSNFWGYYNSYFVGNSAKLGVGLHGYNVARPITYELSYAKDERVSVNGTITAPEGVNVADTTLKVDGSDCDITFNGNAYTAKVPAGQHTFEFTNGDYSATVKDVQITENGTVDAQLYYHNSVFNKTANTSAPYDPNGGTSNSPMYNYNYGITKENADNLFTVAPYGWGMTALFTDSFTKDAFEFTATIKAAATGDNRVSAGLMNGWMMLTVGFAKKGDQNIIRISSVTTDPKNPAYIEVDDTAWLKTIGDGTKNYGDGNVKVTFKVTPGEKIECYVFDTLRFTITKTTSECIDATNNTTLVAKTNDGFTWGSFFGWANMYMVANNANLGVCLYNLGAIASPQYELSYSKNN